MGLHACVVTKVMSSVNIIVENGVIPNCMSTSTQHEDIKNYCDSKMEWSLVG